MIATVVQMSEPRAEDWPAKATETVVGYVDTVRSKTTGPAMVASRAAVYFLAIGLIAVVAAFVLLILLVRLLVALTDLIPGMREGEPWLAYLILGGIFWAVGLLLWRKRRD